MYLMFADEADQDGEKEFLVYAGVFFPSDAVLQLHQKVQALRTKFGFAEDDVLKFSSGTKPKGIDNKTHTEIKNSVLKLAAEMGCKTCCYIVPNDIAKGQPLENRLKYGMNTLLIKFDQFLRECGSLPGAVFFDKTTDFNQAAYLKEVAAFGLDFSGKRMKLEHVVSFASTQTGLSHLAAITDIVVGAFRWVVNEPDKDKVGALLLGAVAKLMWGKPGDDGQLHVRERGFVVRPKT